MTNFTWFSIVAIFSAASISASRVRASQNGERASQSTEKAASNKTSRTSIQGFSELELHDVGGLGSQKYPTADDEQGALCCKRDAPELNGKGGSNGDGEVLMWFHTPGKELSWPGGCPTGWRSAWFSSSCDEYGASRMSTASWYEDTSQRTEEFCGGGRGDSSCADVAVGCKHGQQCCFNMEMKEVDKPNSYGGTFKKKEFSPGELRCTDRPCFEGAAGNGYTVSLHKFAKCKGVARMGAMYHRRRGTLYTP